MEKEAQTSFMHKQRFGERKRLANKTSQTLSQRVIPALDMCRFSCFLSYRCVLLFWNHCLVGLPKVGVAMPSLVGLRNGFLQGAAGLFTSISYCIGHHLSRLSTQRYPDPRLLGLLEHKWPQVIQFQYRGICIISIGHHQRFAQGGQLVCFFLSMRLLMLSILQRFALGLSNYFALHRLSRSLLFVLLDTHVV